MRIFNMIRKLAILAWGCTLVGCQTSPSAGQEEKNWTVVLLHGFDAPDAIEPIEYGGRVWLEPIYDRDGSMIAVAFPNDNIPRSIIRRLKQDSLPITASLAVDGQTYSLECPVDLENSTSGMELVEGPDGAPRLVKGKPVLTEKIPPAFKCREWMSAMRQQILNDKAIECFGNQPSASVRSLYHCFEYYAIDYQVQKGKSPSDIIETIQNVLFMPAVDALTDAGDNVFEAVCDGPLAAMGECSGGGGVGANSNGDYFIMTGSGSIVERRPYTSEVIAISAVERKPASMARVLLFLKVSLDAYRKINQGFNAGDQGNTKLFREIAEQEEKIRQAIFNAGDQHPQGAVVDYVIMVEPDEVISVIPASKYEVPLDGRTKILGNRKVFGRNYQMAVDQGYSCNLELGICTPP